MLLISSPATTTATGPETPRLCASPNVPVTSASEIISSMLYSSMLRITASASTTGDEAEQDPASRLAQEVQEYALARWDSLSPPLVAYCRKMA